MVGDQAYEAGGAARLNEQLEQLGYAFDPAGNLSYRTNNALTANFRVNNLNELTTNTNGGTLTVVGTTTSPASSVSVNGDSANVYNDATFAAAGLPLTTTYTATASDSYGRHSTNTVTVSLSANVAFQYDGNGNLTNDGMRNFVYDDENELIEVLVSNQWMSQFQYDGKMRRRMRKEFSWQGGAWVQTNEVLYVYDGNLVIQERDMNNLPTATYTRGKDLTGSLKGAGGIGGLLARTSQAYSDASLTGQSYYHCDANGNVTMLIDSVQGIVAKYLYDAFGNLISKSGLLADANVYRFSSKEWDANSGLAYYLYRYYDPNLQRWPNRDPLGDQPVRFITKVSAKRQKVKQVPIEFLLYPNLYTYVSNDPTTSVDPLGLWQFTFTFGAGPAGQITFGYNSGQWNLGAYGGVGEGLSASFDPNNAPCKEKGSNWGFKGEGDIGLGPNVDGSGFVSTSDGENEWDVNAGVPGTPFEFTASGGDEGPTGSGTFGLGESTIVGFGGSRNY